ncbi:MAG: DivIVA domain-containing protein [bacterium]|nr:DivIVA domain-containing protein [bacterium]
MPLTPLDIHNKEFSRALRGYREEEVDDFLDLVVREFEALLRENAALRERVQELDKDLRHYRNLEETLNKTLLVAQETAREVKTNAEKEALLAVRQAERQGARIVEEAQARVAKAFADYDELRRRTQVFRVRMRNFLESQLELFQDTEDEWADQASETEPAVREELIKSEIGEWRERRATPPEPTEEIQPSSEPEEGSVHPADEVAATGDPVPGPAEATPPDRSTRRHWLDDLLDEEEGKR